MIDRLRRIQHARSGWYWLVVVAGVVVGEVTAASADKISDGSGPVEAPRSLLDLPTMHPPQSLAQHQDQETTNDTACVPESFKIALDIGHTPQASGATSARGVKEYKFNVQLAKQMESKLIQGGFSNTTLITARGAGRDQLRMRVERANALGADLLLSIHHDDVQEIYYSKWKYGGSLRNYSDRFAGYSLFVSRDNQHFDKSLAFAKLLGRELRAKDLRFSAHHAEPIAGENREIIDSGAGIYRYDDLFVLKFSVAPAVLLEAGIIVNRNEELELSSPERRDQISGAVLAALKEFCGAFDRRPN
ncbi:N-acetylmuramoyl-L-alanine amidase [Bradyrhizobium barranii subsp. barranii]|uniref:N-acetylmuramoyl-L-alanine amidase n=1 Tax=Bradyrhizobium barranii subsp. barranii TaxID=2823807 RepID=A0A7Z0TTL5_9BRAD|nr:N-acetylmuramoyl-L-alanine amidase [Bradyrhizobium barranii]UGX92334.1 N-acetylmuramoyl-L-alanine amidase [Bradyrhizobium barranii subsp. barranii]